jgi:hypothetical protein
MKAYSIYFKEENRVRMVKSTSKAAKVLGMSIEGLRLKSIKHCYWETPVFTVLVSDEIEMSNQGGRRK